MKLTLFRSLWGYAAQPRAEAGAQARAKGFGGLETRLPADATASRELAAVLDGEGLAYIATLFTGGIVLPDQALGVAAHLDDLRRALNGAAPLKPVHANVMAGNDRWPLAQQIDFFGRALEIATESGLSVLFETHRGRSLFNPWITLELIRALPALRFTSDISHWVVVCERLLTGEEETLRPFTERVVHIQARVGYDQGPQVPHPAAPEYAEALAFHQAHWSSIWAAQAGRGQQVTTLTPEFGPDGYLHHLPFTDVPVADLTALNDWMADTARVQFENFIAGQEI